MWVQGDLHRSVQKQQQLRQSRQQKRNMSHLISSVDNMSIDSTILKPASVDEVLKELNPPIIIECTIQ